MIFFGKSDIPSLYTFVLPERIEVGTFQQSPSLLAEKRKLVDLFDEISFIFSF